MQFKFDTHKVGWFRPIYYFISPFVSLLISLAAFSYCFASGNETYKWVGLTALVCMFIQLHTAKGEYNTWMFTFELRQVYIDYANSLEEIVRGSIFGATDNRNVNATADRNVGMSKAVPSDSSGRNWTRQDEIQAQLAAVGLRMEHSLSSLDDAGDAIVDVASDNLADESSLPPWVIQLAEEWTKLEGPVDRDA